MDFMNMELRKDSTPFPEPTSDKAKDGENLSQWFLERSFFRDFVYRNPQKKKGKEFSDCLIIFHDTIIIVHVKTKIGQKDDSSWIETNLNDAIGQLNGSYRNIKEGLVDEFHNELLGYSKKIDLSVHTNIYGLLVFEIGSSPVPIEPFIKKNNLTKIPTNILSLQDLRLITARLDTAADLIVYLEVRFEASKHEKLLINNELENIKKILTYLPEVVSRGNPMLKNSRQFKRGILLLIDTIMGKFIKHPDSKYGMLIDDMIARAHDIDTDRFSRSLESFYTIQRITEIMGYLTRPRRIALGKLLYRQMLQCRDGLNRKFVHLQRPIGQIIIFFFSHDSRDQRIEELNIYVAVAQRKYGFKKVLGIATEAFTGGRSYDFICADELMLIDDAVPLEKFLTLLPDLNSDLFSGEN